MPPARKRRRSSRNPFRRFRKSHSPLVNFLAMVLGMILILVALGFMYRLVAGKPESNRDAPAIQSPAQPLSHLERLATDELDELEDYLIELLASPPKSTDQPEEHIRHRDRVVDVSQRMLELSPSESQRVDALLARLQATKARLKTLIMVRDPEDLRVGGEFGKLVDLATPWLNDPNDAVREAAWDAYLHGTTLAYINDARNRAISPEQLAQSRQRAYQEFETLFENGLSDPATETGVWTMLKQLLLRDFEEAFPRIRKRREMIEGVPRSSTDRLIMKLYDFGWLIENGAREFVESAQSFASTDREATGQIALNIVLNVRTSPWIGEQVLEFCLSTLTGVERRQDEVARQQILDALSESATQLRSPSAASMADKLARHGRQRRDAVGKPIRLETSSVKGVRLRNATLEGRILLLIFADSNGQQLNNVLLPLRDSDRFELPQVVRVIVVWSNENLSSAAREFMKESTNWDFVIEPEGGLFQDFPVDFRPTLLLLDHLHRVAYPNVRMGDLTTMIEELIRQRSDDQQQNLDKREPEKESDLVPSREGANPTGQP